MILMIVYTYKGKNMKVINLSGAPGSGKSTTMLGLTYELKMMGLSVEHTPEFFKEFMAENTSNNNTDQQLELSRFGGQLHILSEQNKRMARWVGKTDFLITDCPLALIAYYTPENYVHGFKELAINLYNTYDNPVNYLIERRHEYENVKRVHDENQSEKVALELPQYYKENGVNFKFQPSSEDLVSVLIDDLIESNIITLDHLAKSTKRSVRNKYSKTI